MGGFRPAEHRRAAPFSGTVISVTFVNAVIPKFLDVIFLLALLQSADTHFVDGFRPADGRRLADREIGSLIHEMKR
jgi:hypothetical protein